MNIRAIGVLSLFLTTALISCSTPDNNKQAMADKSAKKEKKCMPMTTQKEEATASTNEEVGSAPENIEDCKFEFHYTTASGSIEHLKGYRRYLYFSDQGTYEVRTRSGILESSGTYSYKKVQPDAGKLVLMVNNQKGGELSTISMTMIYRSKTEGRFTGSITEGNEAGKVDGRFKLRKR